MSTLNGAFKQAVIEWLATRHVEATEIVSWAEETYDMGYCETCSYTTTDVTITYRMAGGSTDTYIYSGKFSELLGDLLEA